jgi:hypothetical protein
MLRRIAIVLVLLSGLATAAGPALACVCLGSPWQSAPCCPGGLESTQSNLPVHAGGEASTAPCSPGQCVAALEVAPSASLDAVHCDSHLVFRTAEPTLWPLLAAMPLYSAREVRSPASWADSLDPPSLPAASAAYLETLRLRL